MEATKVEVKNIQQLLDRDQYLKHYEKEIRRRFVFLWSVKIFLHAANLCKLQANCKDKFCRKNFQSHAKVD